MNINTVFCRGLLRLVMVDVKERTTPKQRKDAWVYRVDSSTWEFHGPDKYYWYGSADNAYDARAQGWSHWLEDEHPAPPEV